MNQKAKGFFKLGLAVAIFWALINYICPAIIQAIPAYREYAAKADEHNIHTGALFYNDVAQTAEGELYIRNAIRFAPRKTAPDK